MWYDGDDNVVDGDELTKNLTFFDAEVKKNEGDPLKKSRVRVWCPIFGPDKEENWSNWLEVSNFNQGSSQKSGDTGIHWPVAPGQHVMYTTRAGDHMNAFVIPGSYFADDNKPDKQLMIKEAKNAAKKNEDHLYYGLKTLKGAGLQFADKRGSECTTWSTASGASFYIYAPINGEEPTTGPKEATKVAEGPVRGDGLTMTQNAMPVSDLKAACNMGFMGQNGSGIHVVDNSSGGNIIMSCHGSNGSSDGPSFVMSSSGSGFMFLTVGNYQLQIVGDKGIKATYQVIQEPVKVNVEKEYVKKVKDGLKSGFKEAFNIEV